MILLTRTTYDGRPAWTWQDPNGYRWYFYRSGSCWYYWREDHIASSVPYATLEEAKNDLARFFEEA